MESTLNTPPLTAKDSKNATQRRMLSSERHQKDSIDDYIGDYDYDEYGIEDLSGRDSGTQSSVIPNKYYTFKHKPKQVDPDDDNDQGPKEAKIIGTTLGMNITPGYDERYAQMRRKQLEDAINKQRRRDKSD